MAVSQRITAKNIVFKIATVDYACDVSALSLTLNDAPGDVMTFCEVRTGGIWNLQLDGIASGDAASLFQILLANFGTEVAFVVAPHGNATATASQPHYTGTVIFDQLPPIDLSSGEVVKFSVTLSVKNATHTPSATPPVYYGLTKKTSA